MSSPASGSVYSATVKPSTRSARSISATSVLKLWKHRGRREPPIGCGPQPRCELPPRIGSPTPLSAFRELAATLWCLFAGGASKLQIEDLHRTYRSVGGKEAPFCPYRHHPRRPEYLSVRFRGFRSGGGGTHYPGTEPVTRESKTRGNVYR